MCNPHLLWFPLTARQFFISHLPSLISHLSSFIWAWRPPAFCVWLAVQNYIKNQCHPENPSIILLSVNSPSFRYFFPSNLRQIAPCTSPPCSVGFRNPTALNISICNAATILVHILHPASFMVVHKPRRQVITIIVLFLLFISQPTIRIRERLFVFLFGSENRPWDSNQVNLSDVWHIEIVFSDNLGPRGSLIHDSESGESRFFDS